ncbi:DNA adenine methylase [Bacillus solitudinis]|uniref:DNA adenine methylase n=1 Tax=Bacillus solitudinis TaxID=2014074 RepID=UPI000C23A6E1|nr:DNA adenine methylase [Bacillus solitudinis]
MIADTSKLARPVLKWAGGKTQLLNTFETYYRDLLKERNIKKYVEPFAGSGAVLFDIVQKYEIEEAYIWDINPELYTVYEVIKRDVASLISILEKFELEFIPLDKEARKEYYYQIRQDFNSDLLEFDFRSYHEKKMIRAGQFIFLNRTCFNGLFRVNKKGLFNVPIGDYKNPRICDEDNLQLAHQFLQRVHIHLGDYRESRDVIDTETFVYFDPPYRPLNTSSSFTAYSKFDFTDKEQEELATYYRELHERGALLMLSNSDPKNVDEDDNFFDDLYEGFTIERVSARRNINSKGGSRGTISELLITNF